MTCLTACWSLRSTTVEQMESTHQGSVAAILHQDAQQIIILVSTCAAIAVRTVSGVGL